MGVGDAVGHVRIGLAEDVWDAERIAHDDAVIFSGGRRRDGRGGQRLPYGKADGDQDDDGNQPKQYLPQNPSLSIRHLGLVPGSAVPHTPPGAIVARWMPE